MPDANKEATLNAVWIFVLFTLKGANLDIYMNTLNNVEKTRNNKIRDSNFVVKENFEIWHSHIENSKLGSFKLNQFCKNTTNQVSEKLMSCLCGLVNGNLTAQCVVTGDPCSVSSCSCVVLRSVQRGSAVWRCRLPSGWVSPSNGSLNFWSVRRSWKLDQVRTHTMLKYVYKCLTDVAQLRYFCSSCHSVYSWHWEFICGQVMTRSLTWVRSSARRRRSACARWSRAASSRAPRCCSTAGTSSCLATRKATSSVRWL